MECSIAHSTSRTDHFSCPWLLSKGDEGYLYLWAESRAFSPPCFVDQLANCRRIMARCSRNRPLLMTMERVVPTTDQTMKQGACSIRQAQALGVFFPAILLSTFEEVVGTTASCGWIGAAICGSPLGDSGVRWAIFGGNLIDAPFKPLSTEYSPARLPSSFL